MASIDRDPGREPAGAAEWVARRNVMGWPPAQSRRRQAGVAQQIRNER
jgi:hypothetical protein